MKTQKEIEQDIKEYLNKGGKITYIDYGVRKDELQLTDPTRFRKYTLNGREHHEKV